MSEVKSLGPLEAYQFMQEHPNALLVDCRSNMEYLFVGHPLGAVHIPWIDEPDWQINQNFVTQVRQAMLGGVGAAAPVLLICRSGHRSLDAAKTLIAAGFKQVYNITDGFEGPLDEHHRRSTKGGWRYHNLPWEQC
jgi:rhodanese-related sulfurtransferase